MKNQKEKLRVIDEREALRKKSEAHENANLMDWASEDDGACL